MPQPSAAFLAFYAPNPLSAQSQTPFSLTPHPNFGRFCRYGCHTAPGITPTAAPRTCEQGPPYPL